MTGTRIFIVGCGYVGRRLLSRRPQGVPPALALMRSQAGTEAARALGGEPVRIDLDRPPGPERLPTAGTAMYYLAPPPSAGTTDLRLRAWLARLERDGLPARIVYVSTSGVYGDCRGDWVDETRPPHPESDRSRRRLDAEQALAGFAGRHGVAVVVLRVPGIYGPGRLPLERLRQGLPVLAADQAPYTNRVHVDDLVSAAQAAMARAPGGAVYNVSDGEPGRMADYFDAIADAFGLPRPPKVSRAEAAEALTPGMRAFMDESRRLSNRRMIEDLGVAPAYPDLASGLAQCLEEMGQ